MSLSSSLGPLEKQIMLLVWEEKYQTVRQIWQDLQRKKPLAYTTVMTVMSRLVDKGALKREKKGKTYYYSPKVTKQKTLQSVISKTLISFVDRFGEEALATFISEADRLAHQKKKKK